MQKMTFNGIMSLNIKVITAWWMVYIYTFSTNIFKHSPNNCKNLLTYLENSIINWVSTSQTFLSVCIKFTYHRHFLFDLYCAYCYKMFSNHFYKSVTSIKAITSINSTMYQFQNNVSFNESLLNNLFSSDDEPPLICLIYPKFWPVIIQLSVHKIRIIVK